MSHLPVLNCIAPFAVQGGSHGFQELGHGPVFWGGTVSCMHTPMFTQPQLPGPWLFLRHRKRISKALLPKGWTAPPLPRPTPRPGGSSPSHRTQRSPPLLPNSMTWPLSSRSLGFTAPQPEYIHTCIILYPVSLNQHECSAGQGARRAPGRWPDGLWPSVAPALALLLLPAPQHVTSPPVTS